MKRFLHGRAGIAPRSAVLRALSVFALALCFPTAAWCEGWCESIDNRFARFEDNFAIVNWMRNNGWAPADERAIRAHYSFAFDVCRWPRVKWYFTYTGEFDFYMGTRDSGPVVNRLSNPAVHFRVCGDCPAAGARGGYVDVALEHRSNGQVFDVTTPEGALEAQRRYDTKDRYFFDGISRGSNYFSFTRYDRPIDTEGKGYFIRSRVKLYLSKDSQVTWGPHAGKGVSISDYDRLNVLYRVDLGGLGSTFEAEWTIGDKIFKNDSLTLGWTLKRFPVYLRAHAGPMNTLSNYTQRQTSIGIGVRFDLEPELTGITRAEDDTQRGNAR